MTPQSPRVTDDITENLAVRDMKLDRVFAPREKGYLGADVALSVPLDSERALWIFGDTLLGHMEGVRRHFRAMPRNSAALLHSNGINAHAVEWLNDGDADYFADMPAYEDSWFWPGTAFAHGDKVYLIGYDVVQSAGSCESLSFAIRGSRLFRISNVSREPSQWIIDSHSFPAAAPDVFFCSAQLVEDGFVYLMGFHRPGGKEESHVGAVLARLPLSSMDNPISAGEMEVLTSDIPHPTWRRGISQPHHLFEPGVSECSLLFDKPRNRYIATTYDPRDGAMRVTTAERLEGPWSEPVIVFHVPEFRGWEYHHAYTFRMHPELASSPDEMVFTYVVNTKSLETVLDQLDVYYPRFLRMDLRRI